MTLKVKPRPETSAMVAFQCETADLQRVLDLLHGSKSRPVAVHLKSDGEPIGRKFWQVSALFEEKKTTVAWQVATLLGDLKGTPVKQVEQHEKDLAQVVQSFADETAGRLQGGDAPRFTFKANVRPSQTAAFCAAAQASHSNLSVSAEGLNGIIHGSIVADLTQLDAAAILNKLTTLAAEGGGNVVVRRCPPAWKKSLAVWGRPSGDREMMRRVKQTLDPKNVFNPGRLFGDI